MESSYEKIDLSRIRIDIKLTKDDWRRMADKVYNAYASEIEIPGFRAGKAPRNIIDKHIGAKQVFDAIKDEIVSDTIISAIEEHDLKPISRPDVDAAMLAELKDVPDEDVSFSATIETWPVISDFTYKGLKLLVHERNVTDDDVDKAVESLKLRFAERLEVADRGCEDGDYVTFRLKGSAEPLPDAEVAEGEKPPEVFRMEETYVLHLGKDDSIPGLADAIRGMKKGEEKDFEIVIPDQFPKLEVRGRTLASHALITKIEEFKLPELDEAFLREKIGLETIEELREELRKSIENNNSDLKRKEATEAIEEFLLNTVSLTPPPSFIESRKEIILENMRGFYRKQNQDFDQIMADKQQAAEIRDRVAEEADKQVKIEMLYDEIAGKEKVEIKPEEVQNYIYMMQYMGTLKAKDIKKMLKDQNFLLSIRNDLKNKKVIDLLLEKNDITETAEYDKIGKKVEEPAAPDAQATEEAAAECLLPEPGEAPPEDCGTSSLDEEEPEKSDSGGE